MKTYLNRQYKANTKLVSFSKRKKKEKKILIINFPREKCIYEKMHFDCSIKHRFIGNFNQSVLKRCLQCARMAEF